MKTVFILHGGFTGSGPQISDAFFSEMVKRLPEQARVLLVYFAESPEKIEQRKKDDLEQFAKNSNGKQLVFDTTTKEGFEAQVAEADLVYFHGGRTGNLLEALKEYSNLGSVLAGKVVGGDSAGANVLCSVFYSKSLGAQAGLGFVPIKIIPHYREELEDSLENLRPELETLRLKEYEFRVFEEDVSL